MAVTKITVSTAMRARDVSRPREDQLAEAADREETHARATSAAEAAQAAGDRSAVSPGQVPAASAAVPVPAPPRRRRRRGRSSAGEA